MIFVLRCSIFLLVMSSLAFPSIVHAEKVPISTADKEIARLLKDVQRALNKRGYDAGPVDGQYGPKTKAAVKKFRADKGVKGGGLPKVAEALGLPVFKSCFWFGTQLKCPIGCSASIMATQSGVSGYAVNCPGYETTMVPLPR